MSMDIIVKVNGSDFRYSEMYDAPRTLQRDCERVYSRKNRIDDMEIYIIDMEKVNHNSDSLSGNFQELMEKIPEDCEELEIHIGYITDRYDRMMESKKKVGVETAFMNDARNFIVKREGRGNHRVALKNSKGLKIRRRRQAGIQHRVVEYTVWSRNGKKLRFLFDQIMMEFKGLTKPWWKYSTILEMAR